MPPLRMTRSVFWVAIVVTVLLAGGGFLLARHHARESMPAPAAYLIVAGEPLTVRVGWRQKHVAPALPLRSGQSVRIPDGKTAWLFTQPGVLAEVRGPTRLDLAAPGYNENDFLNRPLRQLAQPPPTAEPPPSRGPITVTSPSGLTRFLDPEISWTARDGVTYDVAVVDPADENAPPRILRGVRPPVRLSQLQSTQRPELPSDRIFGVIVRESGNSNMFGVDRFLTARDATADRLPTAPADLLLEGIRALTQKPMRTGDAWLALSRLPPDWLDNELVLRLRLKAATELGATEEAARIRASIQAYSAR